jgi:hypothetical protein
MHRSMIALVAAAFACGGGTALAADPGGKIPIFVKTAAAVGGFTDPDKGRADSVKDLLARLKDSPTLRVVSSPDEAAILLEVLGREKKDGRSVLWGHKEETNLAVQITAGDYTAQFTGASNSNKGWGVAGNYGRAAGEVVKQLEVWTKSNQDKLQALMKAKAEGGTATPPSPSPPAQQ